MLLGAPKAVDQKVEKLVLYSPPIDPANPQLQGLPLLLLEDSSMMEVGWPMFKGEDAGVRATGILHELGLSGPMGAGRQGATVNLHTIKRPELTVGDTMSSVQSTTQNRNNNQWFLVEYAVVDRNRVEV